MDLNSYMSPRMLVGAAVVGLVGAAGVFIYEQVYAEKRRAMLVSEVARLDRQVTSMRTELETLRELQKETELRRQKQKKATARREARQRAAAPAAAAAGDVVDGRAPSEHNYTSDSEYFTDYQSVLGTDGEMESEEFYDVRTDDDDTLHENGHDSDATLDEDLSEHNDSTKSSPRDKGTRK